MMSEIKAGLETFSIKNIYLFIYKTIEVIK